eukprot:650866-Rhodomonas_salina.2
MRERVTHRVLSMRLHREQAQPNRAAHAPSTPRHNPTPHNPTTPHPEPRVRITGRTVWYSSPA